eukprot:8607126-Prorocentrum_lima.AAC.1
MQLHHWGTTPLETPGDTRRGSEGSSTIDLLAVPHSSLARADLHLTWTGLSDRAMLKAFSTAPAGAGRG